MSTTTTNIRARLYTKQFHTTTAYNNTRIRFQHDGSPPEIPAAPAKGNSKQPYILSSHDRPEQAECGGLQKAGAFVVVYIHTGDATIQQRKAM